MARDEALNGVANNKHPLSSEKAENRVGSRAGRARGVGGAGVGGGWEGGGGLELGGRARGEEGWGGGRAGGGGGLGLGGRTGTGAERVGGFKWVEREEEGVPGRGPSRSRSTRVGRHTGAPERTPEACLEQGVP